MAEAGAVSGATVYVVMHGEYGEGGSIDGLYATEDLAMEAARLVKPVFTAWRKDGPSSWVSGCDWLTVEPHTIQGQVST